MLLRISITSRAQREKPCSLECIQKCTEKICGILIIHTEIGFYLPFSDWFGTKRTSVWVQINLKMINTNRFRFELTRLKKILSVCVCVCVCARQTQMTLRLKINETPVHQGNMVQRGLSGGGRSIRPRIIHLGAKNLICPLWWGGRRGLGVLAGLHCTWFIQ